MSQVIQIKRRTIGPGEPANLNLAELAYNTSGSVLYVGGTGNAVHLLVGAERQLELVGAQTIVPGSKKTIQIYDLILLGGAPNQYVMTDGAGNLSFVPAITTQAGLVPVSPPVAGGNNVQTALQGLMAEIDALKARVAVLEGS
jgi:hypothetical protein